MPVLTKKGSVAIVTLDVIGFGLIFVGAVITRYARDEVLSISGSVIVAVGLALLAISRYVVAR